MALYFLHIYDLTLIDFHAFGQGWLPEALRPCDSLGTFQGASQPNIASTCCPLVAFYVFSRALVPFPSFPLALRGPTYFKRELRKHALGAKPRKRKVSHACARRAAPTPPPEVVAPLRVLSRQVAWQTLQCVSGFPRLRSTQCSTILIALDPKKLVARVHLFLRPCALTYLLPPCLPPFRPSVPTLLHLLPLLSFSMPIPPSVIIQQRAHPVCPIQFSTVIKFHDEMRGEEGLIVVLMVNIAPPPL